MYKRDRAIKDITKPKELEEIIKKSKICHIGMVDGNIPYVLAFNFGYKDGTIYLHSALAGRKLDILKKNNNVCVEFDADHELFFRDEHIACSWRWRYKSVLAFGKAEIVENFDEKVEGLKIFMSNYSDRKFEFSKPSVNNINIIRIKIDRMTGRKFEYI
ncbi:MAG: pyridoxamine 5'-phosphate oxidase family protein [Bacteroidetes bacterium]|nr:pyridoxamine 5'-phosphate oxidase family protein [Bacteroidota bacterium]MBL7103999.1 pyridoxamine 5'-phosphate oxidase family protein [Bacteroidales bacterium]